jgi:hypothetical protein
MIETDCQLILTKDSLLGSNGSRLRSDRHDCATHCSVFVIHAHAGIHLKNRFRIKLVFEKSGIRNDRGYLEPAEGWFMDGDDYSLHDQDFRL